MCEKTLNYIRESASDKAFATLLMLDNQQKVIERDITYKGSGSITIEQLIGVIEHHQRERDIWNYITYLIEKDNRL